MTLNLLPRKDDVINLKDELADAINEVLFLPLQSLLDVYIVENEEDNPVVKDIQEGKGEFIAGFVVGKLSLDAIRYLESKGQPYDKKRKGYAITDPELEASIIRDRMDFERRKKASLAYLAGLRVIDMGISEDAIKRPLNTLEKASLAMVKKKVEIPNIKDIQDKFIDSIKKTTETYIDLSINKLTRDLTDSKTRHQAKLKVQLRYEQAKRKSFNMADDQSFYFGAQVRRKVFIANGVESFVWITKKDASVRSSHKDLHGEVFLYDYPPLVDGVEILPGDAFGCRCVDEPIFKGEANV